MVAPVGPDCISFDRTSKKFVINFPYSSPFKDKDHSKKIELFVRANPDSIPYKKVVYSNKNNNNYYFVLHYYR